MQLLVRDGLLRLLLADGKGPGGGVAGLWFTHLAPWGTFMVLVLSALRRGAWVQTLYKYLPLPHKSQSHRNGELEGTLEVFEL